MNMNNSQEHRMILESLGRTEATLQAIKGDLDRLQALFGGVLPKSDPCKCQYHDGLLTYECKHCCGMPEFRGEK